MQIVEDVPSFDSCKLPQKILLHTKRHTLSLFDLYMINSFNLENLINESKNKVQKINDYLLKNPGNAEKIQNHKQQFYCNKFRAKRFEYRDHRQRK